MNKNIQFIVLIFANIFCVFSQELKANVIVNTEQQSKTNDARLDKQLVTDMQNNISQFLNNYKWTEHTFQSFEKINCTFLINITNFSGTRYKASVQVSATRPVYNTNYETQVFSFLDSDWEFDYNQSSSINYNENSYVNALASYLSFYVYTILAYDYDSFAKFGGQVYIDKALQIANSAQGSGDPGWKQSDGSKSRAWLIENLTNTQLQAIREFNYIYHRKSLDTFLETPDKSRENILNGLEALRQMNRIRPNTLVLKWFFNMKDSEIVNLFSKANLETRTKAQVALTELDPTGAEKYNTLLKNQ
ncbi:MAG: DUF4835 family protein [Cytophagales bacterium]